MSDEENDEYEVGQSCSGSISDLFTVHNNTEAILKARVEKKRGKQLIMVCGFLNQAIFCFNSDFSEILCKSEFRKRY